MWQNFPPRQFSLEYIPKKWNLWYKLLHITRMWKISTNKNTATNFPSSILWFRWFLKKLKFGILPIRRGCVISQSSCYLLRLLPLVKRWYFCNKHCGGNEVAQASFKVWPNVHQMVFPINKLTWLILLELGELALFQF